MLIFSCFVLLQGFLLSASLPCKTLGDTFDFEGSSPTTRNFICWPEEFVDILVVGHLPRLTAGSSVIIARSDQPTDADEGNTAPSPPQTPPSFSTSLFFQYPMASLQSFTAPPTSSRSTLPSSIRGGKATMTPTSSHGTTSIARAPPLGRSLTRSLSSNTSWKSVTTTSSVEIVVLTSSLVLIGIWMARCGVPLLRRFIRTERRIILV